MKTINVQENRNNGSLESDDEFLKYGNEHFILHHLRKRFPNYVGLWAVSILFALACCWAFGAYAADADTNMSFARTVFSLFTLTVTLAIPTCLRSIFSAYEEYYSSMIKELLVERFPITLLIMSAFTAIVVGLLYLSGITSIYISIPSTFSLALLGFWTVICVAYMFLAIEKLIHFTANAPGAVLDKLEASIYELVDMETKGDYLAFRDRLASVNDIAATIVHRSTGRDPVVVRCIRALRDIHKTFLKNAISESDPYARKQRYKACRSARRELIRIYREAADSKNEHACHTIVKTYCGMISDAVELNADWLYITEMFSLFERIQSYAFSSRAEEIESYASIDWAIVLIDYLDKLGTKTSALYYTKACIVRELTSSLRRATITDEEDVMLRFCRVASNSEIDCPLDELSDEWLGVIDRVVFDYMTWAFRSAPSGIERWLRYIIDYSSPFNHRMRSVLVDSENRFAIMHDLGRMSESLKQKAKLHGVNDKLDPRIIDGSAFSIGILPGMSRAKALAYVVEASWTGADVEHLAERYISLDEALEKYATMNDESPELEYAVPMLGAPIVITAERAGRAEKQRETVIHQTSNAQKMPDPYKDTIKMRRIIVNDNDDGKTGTI